MRGSGESGQCRGPVAGPQDQIGPGHGGPGRLTVVGLGPGAASLLAPLAAMALDVADLVVGYTAYIDLVPPDFLAGKEVLATGMTGEVARCRAALDAAETGRQVALVSSGDAGVYGMAGLALEMLESLHLSDRVEFSVVPGIPAVCAAAARRGAPLTTRFPPWSACPDLLTPWEAICRRLEAALSADFVLALYNPRSRRRADHLETALALAQRYRGPAIPRWAWSKTPSATARTSASHLGSGRTGLADC